MAQKFQASVHQRDDISFVKLSGVVDEDNDLGPLAEQLAAGAAAHPTVVVDLRGIDRINSCGVRDWVNWLGRVEKHGASVVLVECSPAIVAQINLVHNFTGSGAVKSFYAPYYCPNCDLEKALLCESRDFAEPGRYKAPTCRCDECDGVMEFDDMEDSYFAFLGTAKRLPQDPRIEQVIEEFTPSEGDLKLRGRSNPGNPVPQIPGPSAQNPGSLPSVPSLPSLRTPTPGSAPGGLGSISSSQRWPLLPPEEMSRRVVQQPQARALGAWVLVGVLVVTALMLLAWVFLGSPKRPAAPPAAVGATR